MNVARHARTYVAIGTLLIIASALVIGLMGLNFGIDFTGGTLLERGLPGTVTADAVRQGLSGPELADLDVGSAVLQPVDGVREGETVMIIRAGELSNSEIARIDDALGAAFGSSEVRRTEMVGPSIGRELIQRSVWALVLAAIAVAVYVAFRFEYRFGIAALFAQLLDVLFVVANPCDPAQRDQHTLCGCNPHRCRLLAQRHHRSVRPHP